MVFVGDIGDVAIFGIENKAIYLKHELRVIGQVRNTKAVGTQFAGHIEYIVPQARRISRNRLLHLNEIFADKKFIGGCNDIYQLESQNKLDEALS